MIDITKLKKGDNVHYVPKHYKNEGKWENGVVKSVTPNGVFVVYNCGGEWHNFQNYTAANTRPEDLFEGWRYEPVNT